MENPIPITLLNDFVFCPASIYYHQIDEPSNSIVEKSQQQINGSAAHESIDENKYSSSAHILQGITVYSSHYNLIGKIDVFDTKTGQLTERKRTVTRVYDGYVFQLYGQFFGLHEAGYKVRHLSLHSLTDNKNYPVDLPENNPAMLHRFKQTIDSINSFSLSSFQQDNSDKCRMCIYRFLCPYDISEP